MGLVKQVGLWASVGALAVSALLVLEATVGAQDMVTVQLEAVEDSGVTGTATLTAEREGTNVGLYVTGLDPGTSARATMHAGSCAIPSASFAVLPDLTADAAGSAKASGHVLFRGTGNVALETMADGEHIVAIQTERVVACGVIPPLVPAPARLPATGQPASSAPAAAAGVAGVGVASLCAWLLSRRRAD